MSALLTVATVVLPTLLWCFKGLLIGVALVPAWGLVSWAWAQAPWWGVVALGPAYYVFGLSLSLIVVLTKWGLLYRARAGAWSFFCARTAQWALVSQLNDMAVALFLHQVRGSWFLNTYFRLLGAKIGRGVIINTTLINDWDLIEIGDGTMIGHDAVVLGHVGEKGQLRMAPVRIGHNCTIGRDTCVFPGAVIEDGAVVAAMTVVPKNKTLPAGSMWGGTELRELGAKKKSLDEYKQEA